MDTPSNNGNTKRRLELKRGSLTVRLYTYGATFKFYFDEEYAGYEIKSTLSNASRKYELWRLLPTPNTDSIQDTDVDKRFNVGVVFLVAAFVVHFSTIPTYVPYLAPVLFVFGLTRVCYGIIGRRKIPRTQFYGDGCVLISIPHASIKEGDLDSFVSGLSTAIRAARKKRYGVDAI